MKEESPAAAPPLLLRKGGGTLDDGGLEAVGLGLGDTLGQKAMEGFFEIDDGASVPLLDAVEARSDEGGHEGEKLQPLGVEGTPAPKAQGSFQLPSCS